MVKTAFWVEEESGKFVDFETDITVAGCTDDADWPIEIQGKNPKGELVGVSISMVDSFKLYYTMFKQFGPMFS